MGINTFSDLFDFDKLQQYERRLLKFFESLILFQPEILDSSVLTDEELLFMMEYRNSNAWIELKKKSQYQFREKKKKFSSLIDKQCPFNYKTELIRIMASQLG